MTTPNTNGIIPSATPEDFLAYDMGDLGGACPWCGAEWVPAPATGKGAESRTHNEGCPFWAWIEADDEFGPGSDDPYELRPGPETTTCPLHGEQEVTGHGSTGGPDPYGVDILACGDAVMCLGPGEPNVITTGYLLDLPPYSEVDYPG